jgi:hypothetical protein
MSDIGVFGEEMKKHEEQVHKENVPEITRCAVV